MLTCYEIVGREKRPGWPIRGRAGDTGDMARVICGMAIGQAVIHAALATALANNRQLSSSRWPEHGSTRPCAEGAGVFGTPRAQRNPDAPSTSSTRASFPAGGGAAVRPAGPAGSAAKRGKVTVAVVPVVVRASYICMCLCLS